MLNLVGYASAVAFCRRSFSAPIPAPKAVAKNCGGTGTAVPVTGVPDIVNAFWLSSGPAEFPALELVKGGATKVKAPALPLVPHQSTPLLPEAEPNNQY
jgi:hypothetical protein